MPKAFPLFPEDGSPLMTPEDAPVPVYAAKRRWMADVKRWYQYPYDDRGGIAKRKRPITLCHRVSSPRRTERQSQISEVSPIPAVLK